MVIIRLQCLRQVQLSSRTGYRDQLSADFDRTVVSSQLGKFQDQLLVVPGESRQDHSLLLLATPDDSCQYTPDYSVSAADLLDGFRFRLVQLPTVLMEGSLF